MEVNTIACAKELPDEWDRMARDYFQVRDFLAYTEKFNPCNQRYYVLMHEGSFQCGVVVYSLKLDLFTFLSIRSPFLMNIAGIPCSVSSGGIIGDPGFSPDLLEHIITQEKGLFLVLNLESNPEFSGMIRGRTLPSIVLKNQFQSWEAYMNSLRSNYRRRFLRFSEKFSGIRKSSGSCSRFDDQMYRQYIQVLKRSKGKLETLSPEFFINLPSEFRLTAYYHKDVLAGWYISIIYGEKFYFFLGGINYDLNEKFSTYFNLLLGVLREGVESQARYIDLGQTAEIPKMRLGGELHEKTMMACHSNRLMNGFLRAGRGLLEYSFFPEETHVIKEPQ